MRLCVKPSSRRRSRKAGKVLVRIERCWACATPDLHIQDGYADLGGGKKLDTTRGMTLPFTLGHEIAGVVEEVGSEVSNDLIGAKKRSSRG
jgi:alcohol dehydrogenase